VGYENIEDLLSNDLLPQAAATLCGLKFLSWAVSLGSGTSGGTLAPLLTVGAGSGGLLGTALALWQPHAGLDPRVAALVGMAAMFAGASHALLTSVVFAFEVTRQPLGLLPLLGGCTSAFLVSALLMRHSIMTEKIARRGVRALGEYAADYLDQLCVRDYARRELVTIAAEDTVESVRQWLASAKPGSSHQGFPVVDATGELLGVVTRKDLAAASSATARVRELLRRPCIVIQEDDSLRDAADLMAREHIGRLPVVRQAGSLEPVGILTRSDLVEAHFRRLTSLRPPDHPRSRFWSRSARVRARAKRRGPGTPSGEPT
jgi:CBS domain-containing protein